MMEPSPKSRTLLLFGLLHGSCSSVVLLAYEIVKRFSSGCYLVKGLSVAQLVPLQLYTIWGEGGLRGYTTRVFGRSVALPAVVMAQWCLATSGEVFLVDLLLSMQLLWRSGAWLPSGEGFCRSVALPAVVMAQWCLATQW